MNYWKYSMVALFMLLLVASAGTFFVYVAPLAIVGLLAFASGVTAALVAGVMIGNAYRELADRPDQPLTTASTPPARRMLTNSAGG